MPKVVYKYVVNSDRSPVEISADARIVKVGRQGEKLFVWAEHWLDGNVGTRKRYFDVFGTGQTIPDDAVHVETFFDGLYVWHVYETHYVAPTQVPL